MKSFYDAIKYYISYFLVSLILFIIPTLNDLDAVEVGIVGGTHPEPDRNLTRVVRLHESQLHRQVEGHLLKGRQFPEVSPIQELVEFAH